MRPILHILLVVAFGFLLTLVPAAPLAPDDRTLAAWRAEAQKAFEYLNKVRADPPAFVKEIGVPELKDVKPLHALKWHETLAKAAEAKALDMATRNYVAHVNPEGFGMNIKIHEAGYELKDFQIKSKELNYFESIAAGSDPKYTGIAAVRQLILDKDTPSLGHRKHLLGLEELRAKHTDIGIGFANNPKSKYKNYVCFLIANQ